MVTDGGRATPVNPPYIVSRRRDLQSPTVALAKIAIFFRRMLSFRCPNGGPFQRCPRLCSDPASCDVDHRLHGEVGLPSGMCPRKCRQLATELRQYADDHPTYSTHARDAADRLEALAEEMDRRGLGGDDDPDAM
jgi:hypothetical protein